VRGAQREHSRMNAEVAKAKFKSADALFRAGQYAEALKLLAELEATYPNARRVLYPKALCLEKLGQLDEADVICDRLIEQFQDARAQELKLRLQAARSPIGGDLGIPGLDTSLVDDLLEPASKPPPPPPAPPSNLLRNVLIAAAVLVVVCGVGAAGLVGVKQGWFAGDTVESVEAELVGLWNEADARSAIVSLSCDVPLGAMPMALSVSAGADYLKQDDGVLFRLEGNNSTKTGQMTVDMPFALVSDGRQMHVETTMMGQTVVLKMPIPGDALQTSNTAQTVLDDLHREFDVKLLPKEPLDGKPAYVLQYTPKPGAAATGPIPGMDVQVGNIKLWAEKAALSHLKMVIADTAGTPIATLQFKDIRANPSLTSDRFKYNPPPGAKVLDMAELTKMMPMMPKM